MDGNDASSELNNGFTDQELEDLMCFNMLKTIHFHSNVFFTKNLLQFMLTLQIKCLYVQHLIMLQLYENMTFF